MTPFQLNDELLDRIGKLIDGKKDKALKSLLSELHYADMAEIIDELSLDEGIYLIKLIDSEKTSDVLTELNEDVREKILKELSAKEIAGELEELDTDDAADIIGELPEERQERVMAQISDESHVEDIRELLLYDENSAGGLMAKELVKVNENWTVLKCVREMRLQAEEVTRVHSIYVVDENDKLVEDKSLMVTHVTFHPVLLSANRTIVVDYTITIQIS